MEEIYEDKFSRFMQFVIGLPTETTEQVEYKLWIIKALNSFIEWERQDEFDKFGDLSE